MLGVHPRPMLGHRPRAAEGIAGVTPGRTPGGPRMTRRALALPLALPLAALLLAACSADAARHPLAPSASSLAARGGAATTQAKHVHGTLEAEERGVPPQPGTTLVPTHRTGEGTASHLGRFAGA